MVSPHKSVGHMLLLILSMALLPSMIPALRLRMHEATSDGSASLQAINQDGAHTPKNKSAIFQLQFDSITPEAFTQQKLGGALCTALAHLLKRPRAEFQMFMVQQADMDQVDDTDLPWRQPKVYAYFVFTPPSHINIAGMVGQVAKLAETGAFQNACWQLGLEYMRSSFKAEVCSRGEEGLVTLPLSTYQPSIDVVSVDQDDLHSSQDSAATLKHPASGRGSKPSAAGKAGAPVVAQASGSLGQSHLSTAEDTRESTSAQQMTADVSDNDWGTEAEDDPVSLKEADKEIDTAARYQDLRLTLKLRGVPLRVAQSQQQAKLDWGSNRGPPASNWAGWLGIAAKKQALDRLLRVGSKAGQEVRLKRLNHHKIEISTVAAAEGALEAMHEQRFADAEAQQASQPPHPLILDDKEESTQGRVRAGTDFLQEALTEAEQGASYPSQIGVGSLQPQHHPAASDSHPASVETINVVVTETEKYHQGSNFGELVSWTLAELVMLFMFMMMWTRYRSHSRRSLPGSPTYSDLKKRVEDLDAQLAAARQDANSAKILIKHATL